MFLGPFLRRELIASVRRGTAFSGRRSSVLLMTAVAAADVVIWDWWGWDRTSVAGAASFALSMFGLIVAAHAVLATALVPALIAPMIASERDRKSLDSLLATRVSAADIVLGAMGAGLLRYTNDLAASVPVIVVLVFLGGIDPRLVLLAVAVLASTALALAALAVAVSAGARTASRAVSYAVALAMAWMLLPHAILTLVPRLWPAVLPWVAPVVVGVLHSSPVGVGVMGVLLGGRLVDAALRMIALQTPAAVALVVWAIARLRPASRAAHDAEGRAATLRLLRARWRPRPACGDDPVLWHEVHGARAIGGAWVLVDRLFNVFWIGLLAYATSWFAVPAFAELAQRGYGPALGKPADPDVNPIARVIVGKLMSLPVGLTPGQARWEFNIVLRQTTGLLDFLYVLMVAGAAAESVARERERDTWLGLIVTPLTGWEILRAKMLGSIWRSRGLAFIILAFWIVGLLAGAVHPLGFLAALTGMGVSCWFLAALGVAVSLRARDLSQATGTVLGPLILSVGLSALPFLLPGTASVLLAAWTMPFQTWVSLLSYEDVHAAIHAGAPPQFAVVGIQSVTGARMVLAAWLLSTIAQAVAAFLLTRSAVREFDAIIGRPVRGRGDAHRS